MSSFDSNNTDRFLLDSFHSSVLEAVLETLALEKPLLVFLSRQDSESNSFITNCLSCDSVPDEETITLLESEYVRLRLVHGTTEYGYFKEIFGVLMVPSVCIVRRQSLVDVIYGDVSANDFKQRVRAAASSTSESSPPTSAVLPRSSEFPDPALSGTPVDPQASPLDSTSEIESVSSAALSSVPLSSAALPSIPLSSARPLLHNNESKSDPAKTNNNEENVRKHKREVREKKRQHAVEKQRLRVLLEADRKEVALRFQALQNSGKLLPSLQNPSHKATPPHDKNCVLLIKFFDGSSLRCNFESTQTLGDVRHWLDTDSGVEIIPKKELLPLFASSPYLQPVQYVFHLPELPRITYTTADESSTLADLGLCPRSALILKPVYEDANAANVDIEGPHRGPGLLSSLRRGLGVVGGALYSFFDYGANVDNIHPFSDDEGGSDEEQSGLGSMESSGHEQFARPLFPGSGTPSLILITPHGAAGPALINMEDPPLAETTRPSRPGTPRMTNRPGAISRVALNFGEMAPDRKEKDTEVYNGNAVNLDQRKDDE